MLRLRESPVLSRLRRGTFDAFVLHGIGVALLFAMHTVIARALGAAGYGTFSHAIATAATLAVTAALGWPQALLRLLSQYSENREWRLLRGVMARASQSTLALSVAGGVLMWALAVWWVTDPPLKTSLKLAGSALPLLAFIRIRRLSLRAFERVRASIIPDEIVLPLIMISGVVSLSIHRLQHAWLLYLIAVLTVFAISTAWLRRALPSEAKAEPPAYLTRFWLSIAVAMMFSNLSQVLIQRSDVIMLGALRPPSEVGLYAAAKRLALLNTFTLTAVQTIASPLIAAAYYGGRQQQVGTIMRESILWSALGALPLYALILIVPQWLLSFFGNEFTQGATLLRILGTGHFINALTGPVGIALLMTGRERIVAAVTAAAAVANIAGHFFAISLWGALGAARVTALTVIALNSSLMVAYLIDARKKTVGD